MIVLGLDTSTEVAAIGLRTADKLIGEININLKQRHSERLLPNIKYLLAETGVSQRELSGLAVSRGPGSYTGLRIGLTTIKTMAQILQIPVIGLSTLAVIAANLCQQEGWLLPLLDARHQRVYTALFYGEVVCNYGEKAAMAGPDTGFRRIAGKTGSRAGSGRTHLCCR